MIHQAGPVIDDVQPCTRCGVTLKDFTTGSVLTRYPEGALVEVTPVFQAMRLDVKEPTCEAKEPEFCAVCDEPITGDQPITLVTTKAAYCFCCDPCLNDFMASLEDA